MATERPFVIVGAGLAGARTAESLRAEGFSGRVTLIGEERELPYERPPLSKDYLMGKSTRETTYVHEQPWYADHDIDLRLDVPVTEVDPAEQTITLADGDRVGYAKLLLSTGSSPRRLPVPGAELDGVFYLRSLDDSEYTGYVEPGGYDEVVIRGDVTASEFVAFWIDHGRVLAGMNVNVWDVTDPIESIIRNAEPVDTRKLAGPLVPLASLVRSTVRHRSDPGA